jgi:ABC-2 type transport system permease protein
VAFNLVLNVFVFYFGDQEANIGLATYLGMCLAGGVFPLAFLPDKIERYFRLLPFQYLFDVPSNIYLGHYTFDQIIWIWGKMAIWSIVLYLIFSILYRSGLKRFTGTGR